VADLVRVVVGLARDEGQRMRARADARKAWADGGHEPVEAASALLAALGELTGDVA
jgi:hypothetical protein